MSSVRPRSSTVIVVRGIRFADSSVLCSRKPRLVGRLPLGTVLGPDGLPMSLPVDQPSADRRSPPIDARPLAAADRMSARAAAHRLRTPRAAAVVDARGREMSAASPRRARCTPTPSLVPPSARLRAARRVRGPSRSPRRRLVRRTARAGPSDGTSSPADPPPLPPRVAATWTVRDGPVGHVVGAPLRSAFPIRDLVPDELWGIHYRLYDPLGPGAGQTKTVGRGGAHGSPVTGERGSGG
jgi:hypothetical protein